MLYAGNSCVLSVTMTIHGHHLCVVFDGKCGARKDGCVCCEWLWQKKRSRQEKQGAFFPFSVACALVVGVVGKQMGCRRKREGVRIGCFWLFESWLQHVYSITIIFITCALLFVPQCFCFMQQQKILLYTIFSHTDGTLLSHKIPFSHTQYCFLTHKRKTHTFHYPQHAIHFMVHIMHLTRPPVVPSVPAASDTSYQSPAKSTHPPPLPPQA